MSELKELFLHSCEILSETVRCNNLKICDAVLFRLQFVLVNETELVFSWSCPAPPSPHHEHNDRDHRGQQHRAQY